jgi:hypothetical protein
MKTAFCSSEGFKTGISSSGIVTYAWLKWLFAAIRARRFSRRINFQIGFRMSVPKCRRIACCNHKTVLSAVFL